MDRRGDGRRELSRRSPLYPGRPLGPPHRHVHMLQPLRILFVCLALGTANFGALAQRLPAGMAAVTAVEGIESYRRATPGAGG